MKIVASDSKTAKELGIPDVPMSGGGMTAIGYLYDAEGRRVAKGIIPASSTTPLPSSMCSAAANNNFMLTESYIMGQSNEELTTLTWSGSTSTWTRTNVYGCDDDLSFHQDFQAATDPTNGSLIQTDTVSGQCNSVSIPTNAGNGGQSFVQPQQQKPTAPNNVFKCAANVATNHSIAGGLHALGIGNNGGVGGFLTNTFGGNTFSGITNLVSTLGSSSSTDQQVLGQMGKALLRGPLQGIPGSFVGASGAFAAPGITSLVRGGVIGAAFNAANSSGSLTTLAGEASIVANTGAEFASGVGEAKFVLDAVTYGASLAACYAGVAH